MQINSKKLLTLAPLGVFALAVMLSPLVARADFGPAKASVQSSAISSMPHIAKHGGESFIRLADGHADICAQNKQTCLDGCAGATSCSNQCQDNYDRCMQQGQ
jgi:hypothetical protein